jgi:hypothetical protein
VPRAWGLRGEVHWTPAVFVRVFGSAKPRETILPEWALDAMLRSMLGGRQQGTFKYPIPSSPRATTAEFQALSKVVEPRLIRMDAHGRAVWLALKTLHGDRRAGNELFIILRAPAPPDASSAPLDHPPNFDYPLTSIADFVLVFALSGDERFSTIVTGVAGVAAHTVNNATEAMALNWRPEYNKFRRELEGAPPDLLNVLLAVKLAKDAPTKAKMLLLPYLLSPNIVCGVHEIAQIAGKGLLDLRARIQLPQAALASLRREIRYDPKRGGNPAEGFNPSTDMCGNLTWETIALQLLIVFDAPHRLDYARILQKIEDVTGRQEEIYRDALSEIDWPTLCAKAGEGEAAGCSAVVREWLVADPRHRVIDRALGLLSRADLLFVRNAFFAHHGYSFANQLLHQYFSQKAWYRPSDRGAESLSPEENRLVEQIKAAQRRTDDAVRAQRPSEFAQPGSGLVWARCYHGQRWDGSRCLGVPLGVNIDAAPQECAPGFRMARVDELQELIGYNAEGSPCRHCGMNDVVTHPLSVWAAPSLGEKEGFWFVDLNSGVSTSWSRNKTLGPVLCVKAAETNQ